MSSVLDTIRIALLKKHARSLLWSIRHQESAYDCGMVLQNYISPDLRGMREKFNSIMDELAEIDPEAPKHRLNVDTGAAIKAKP